MSKNIFKIISASAIILIATSSLAIAGQNSTKAKSSIQNLTSRKVINNWCDDNANGYMEYIIEFNKRGNHCRNMCEEHKEINLYDYGFKDSYLGK